MCILRLAVIALLTAGCAVDEAREEPISWSAEWFQCDSRFDCIAVYDAYCRYTAVNANYSLIYQDWARQEVERLDELVPCPPDHDDVPVAAYCRKNKCEH